MKDEDRKKLESLAVKAVDLICVQNGMPFPREDIVDMAAYAKRALNYIEELEAKLEKADKERDEFGEAALLSYIKDLEAKLETAQAEGVRLGLQWAFDAARFSSVSGFPQVARMYSDDEVPGTWPWDKNLDEPPSMLFMPMLVSIRDLLESSDERLLAKIDAAKESQKARQSEEREC